MIVDAALVLDVALVLAGAGVVIFSAWLYAGRWYADETRQRVRGIRSVSLAAVGGGLVVAGGPGLVGADVGRGPGIAIVVVAAGILSRVVLSSWVASRLGRWKPRFRARKGRK